MESQRSALAGEDVPEDFIDEVERSLAGLGMCRFQDDGSCKPKKSWPAFLEQLRILSGKQKSVSWRTSCKAEKCRFSVEGVDYIVEWRVRQHK